MSGANHVLSKGSLRDSFPSIVHALLAMGTKIRLPVKVQIISV